MMRTLIALLLLSMLALSGCGPRGSSYDAGAVIQDLQEMLREPADFPSLYVEYRQTTDFAGFLEELRASLRESVVSTRDPREALSAALELIRRHHLEELLLSDPLLLERYRADLLLALLVLEGDKGFLAGLHELTVRGLNGNGVRPEVVAGLARALRVIHLRQPFHGASPPYAAQTHGDLVGEIPAAVELALRLLREGWEIAGFYEEGRAKVVRTRFLDIAHLQAMIDLVATGRSRALFLQVEQALDGTDRDLRQVVDRVEATAYYLQEGGLLAEFGPTPGLQGIVVLVVREGRVEELWQEIERRAGLLKRPIPILMVHREGGLRMINLTAAEAAELRDALGYSSSP